MKAVRLDYNTDTLSSTDSGQSFLTTLTFAASSEEPKDFSVVVDTGSSDTWLASSELTCLEPATNVTLSKDECAFGELFDAEESESLQRIDGLEFNVTYSDGEFVTGFMAKEDVRIAGIDVKGQQVGVVELAGWDGDGISSGLLGLAFPSITSAFAVQDQEVGETDKPKEGEEKPKRHEIQEPSDGEEQEGEKENVEYSPLFTTMHESGLIDPIFSIALSRDESSKGHGGVLALGGIPEQDAVEGGYDETFASADIEVMQVAVEGRSAETQEHTFYAIKIDGLSYSAGEEEGAEEPEEPAGTEEPCETASEEPVGSEDPKETEEPASEAKEPAGSEEPCETASEEPVGPEDPKETEEPADSDRDEVGHHDKEEHESGDSAPCWLRSVRERYATSKPQVSQLKHAIAPRHTYTGGIDPATEDIQMVIDSGTTLIYVPTDAAANFNGLWSPPAYTSEDEELKGLYLVDCNATAPSFDVMVEGEKFSTNPVDLSLELTGDGKTCLSGVQDAGGNGGQALFILGDVWLKNVLAVFDVGNNAVRVASRMNYES